MRNRIYLAIACAGVGLLVGLAVSGTCLPAAFLAAMHAHPCAAWTVATLWSGVWVGVCGCYDALARTERGRR